MKLVDISNLDESWKEILKNEEKVFDEFIENELKKKEKLENCFINLKNLFKIEIQINCINGFDNSHFGGKNQTGVCVFWKDGDFIKDEYRQYNFKTIEDIGDDYNMMQEMLTRRLKEIKQKKINVDLFVIDGGKHQMSAVENAMNLTNIEIPFICIKKGEKRDWKNDTFLYKNLEIKMNENYDGLKLLQAIRDEAHRFAGRVRSDKDLKILKL